MRLETLVKKLGIEELKSHASGIVIVGLADDTGIKNVQGRTGAKFGPKSIRECLYKLNTAPLKHPLYDLGDLEPENTIEKSHKVFEEALFEIHSAGHIPLVFGGGHDLAYPEAAALLRAQQSQCAFINVDAHLDLRNTDKGITSGSPWYLLSKNRDYKKYSCQIYEFGIQEHCNADELIEYAKKEKIKIRLLREIKNASKDFLKLLNAIKKPSVIQVSLDIDSVRLAEAPGCSAPQVLGFTAQEFIRFSELSGKSKKVRSFGIYEVSPPLDFDAHTAKLAAQAALAFIQAVSTRKIKL